MKMEELKKQIYLIEDFWSSQRCDEYISKTESIGYQPAKAQTENGPRVIDFVP
jgi:prolyl 4-hydroxylase